MERVHARIGRQVGPEQDPIRPAQEERPRRVGLAAELGEPRGDVDVEVRAALEDGRDAPQVLGRAADVSADERGRRMSDDDGLEPVDQLVEWREAVEVRAPARPGRPEVPVGVRRAAPPSARWRRRAARRTRSGRRRGWSPGRPARRRSPTAGRDGGRRPRQPPGGVASPQTEGFHTLSPAAPAATPARSRRRLHLAEVARRGPRVVVEPGEDRDAAGEPVTPAIDLLPQGVPPATVEIHDRRDARRVERRRRARPAGASPRRPRTASGRGGCGRRSPGRMAGARRAWAPGACVRGR